MLVALALSAAPAAAQTYVPPGSHVFAGLTGGTSLQPIESMVGKHPPVFEIYMRWNTPTAWLAAAYPGFRSRLALQISTASGYGGRGDITPLQIAKGRSDRFLVSLGRNLASSGRIVYLRLMGEMNGYWNAYAAFNANGSSRGVQNSPRAYVAAWRRSVLILRGGPVAGIDRRLRALRLPPLRLPSQRAGVARARSLPRPRVAFLWVPQDAGSPPIAANAPGAYWPGSPYVDWVGTDFYASFPNFSRLSTYYSEFPGKPFVLSEWALYGSDDPGFVRELFAWVAAHPRVRMLNYYQGFVRSSLANLERYPASQAVLRAELRSPRFLAYAPEYAHPGRRQGPGRPPRPPAPGPVPSPVPLPSPGCVSLLAVCLPPP